MNFGKAKAVLLLIVGIAFMAGALVSGGFAQEGGRYVPGLWRGEVVHPKPDLSGLATLRIVTEADYPPFNYFDEDGRLTGFNVELVQALCEVLNVQCRIEARDWELLLPALGNRQADIVAASISITPQSLKLADFTHRYYDTPARFVSKKGRDLRDITPEALAGKKVGVLAGSSHEAYLKEYYKGARLVAFKQRKEMHKALISDKIDLAFDDGITLVFWLNGTGSKSCCIFRGGPMIDHKYFGNGIGLAVPKGRRRLRELLNYALEKVRRDGTYEELFLRYFPLSFY